MQHIRQHRGQQISKGTIARSLFRTAIVSGLLLGLAFADPSPAVQHQPILAHSQPAKESPASLPNSTPEEMPNQPTRSDAPFRQIEQPLSLKLAVIVGAFALIGLELWWFLGQSRRKDA